jgi:hypothetical protein
MNKEKLHPDDAALLLDDDLEQQHSVAVAAAIAGVFFLFCVLLNIMSVSCLREPEREHARGWLRSTVYIAGGGLSNQVVSPKVKRSRSESQTQDLPPMEKAVRTFAKKNLEDLVHPKKGKGKAVRELKVLPHFMHIAHRSFTVVSADSLGFVCSLNLGLGIEVASAEESREQVCR